MEQLVIATSDTERGQYPASLETATRRPTTSAGGLTLDFPAAPHSIWSILDTHFSLTSLYTIHEWVATVYRWIVYNELMNGNVLLPMSMQYLGGFFDGEGCVFVSFGSRRPSVRITMTQADRDILVQVRDFLNLGGVYAQRHYWAYNVSARAEVRQFCDYLIPMTRLKRYELMLARVWTETRRRSDIQELLEYQALIRGRPVRTGRVART